MKVWCRPLRSEKSHCKSGEERYFFHRLNASPQVLFSISNYLCIIRLCVIRKMSSNMVYHNHASNMPIIYCSIPAVFPIVIDWFLLTCCTLQFSLLNRLDIQLSVFSSSRRATSCRSLNSINYYSLKFRLGTLLLVASHWMGQWVQTTQTFLSRAVVPKWAVPCGGEILPGLPTTSQSCRRVPRKFWCVRVIFHH